MYVHVCTRVPPATILLLSPSAPLLPQVDADDGSGGAATRPDRTVAMASCVFGATAEAAQAAVMIMAAAAIIAAAADPLLCWVR